MRLLFLLLLSATCHAQNEVTANTYKPYLVEYDSLKHAVTITGANTFSKDKSKGQTDVDTVFCWVEIADTVSGLTVTSKDNGLTYHVSFGIHAYGLWVHDYYDILGDHWNLFDERGRLIRGLPNMVITRIMELGSTSKRKK